MQTVGLPRQSHVEERLAGRRAITAEELMRRIGVENCAHLQPQRTSCFSLEEIAITGRSAQNIPVAVQSEGVDADIEVAAFEKQDRNVLRLQLPFSIANIHAHPVEQMVAVRFHHQLALRSRNPAEQAPERRLGAGVEVRLRLL